MAQVKICLKGSLYLLFLVLLIAGIPLLAGYLTLAIMVFFIGNVFVFINFMIEWSGDLQVAARVFCRSLAEKMFQERFGINPPSTCDYTETKIHRDRVQYKLRELRGVVTELKSSLQSKPSIRVNNQTLVLIKDEDGSFVFDQTKTASMFKKALSDYRDALWLARFFGFNY